MDGSQRSCIGHVQGSYLLIFSLALVNPDHALAERACSGPTSPDPLGRQLPRLASAVSSHESAGAQHTVPCHLRIRRRQGRCLPSPMSRLRRRRAYSNSSALTRIPSSPKPKVINTVNFSNHSGVTLRPNSSLCLTVCRAGYGRFGGTRTSASELQQILQIMEENQLPDPSRLLTGEPFPVIDCAI